MRVLLALASFYLAKTQITTNNNLLIIADGRNADFYITVNFGDHPSATELQLRKRVIQHIPARRFN